MKNIYLATVAFSCLAGVNSGAAWAAAANAEAPADTTGDAASAEIVDIIVTANRREESVQKSSVPLQVLTGEELNRVNRAQDINALAPGLQIGSAGPNPQVYIRGVGDNASNSRTQSAVVFNVDGVVLTRGSPTATAFFDLARIEVLKGPQGTLYGRNSSGGVINIITNRPKLMENSADVGASVGNFNLIDADAAVNLAIGDTLAVRLAGQYVSRDGYLSDGGQDQHTRSGRIRVLWEPSPTFSILLNGDLSHIGGQGSGVVLLPVQNGNPWRSITQQPLTYPFLFNPATAPFTQPNDRFIDSRIGGASAELKADLGFATLTVLPAYRFQNQEYLSYNTNFRFVEVLREKTHALEARLSHESEVLKWVVGVYGSRQKNAIESDNSQGSLTANVVKELRNSRSVFGQATLTVAQGLRVIGGVRYTNEGYSGSYVFGTGAYPVFPFVATPGTFTNVAKTSVSRVSWKAGGEFDVSPTSMLYATAASGFKAGGFEGTPACAGGSTYTPEKLKAFELGSRNRFFGNKLQINAEAFYWKYANQQLSALQPNACGVVSFFTRNVGSSTIKGLNLDVTWRATARDTLSLSGEYADGRYDKFTFTQTGLGAYAPSMRSVCSATPTGGGIFSVDCSGQQLLRLPKFSGQARYSHRFDVVNEGTLTPSLNLQAASRRWLDIGYGPNGHADAYLRVDSELSYAPKGDFFTITAFVHNIFNEAIYTSGTNVGVLLADGTRFTSATIEPPRTYGVRVRAKF